MANPYFDSLFGRSTTQGMLDTYGDYDENGNPLNFVSGEIDNLPAINSNEDSAPFLSGAGFQQHPTNPNEMVTPSRSLVEHYTEKADREAARVEAEYLRKKESPLFRIGDTLADAGRLFMSPLFWLSGEDTSKYDPSARLDAGYKTAMKEADALRVGMYQKLVNARDARLGRAETMYSNSMTRRKQIFDMNQPQSSEQKSLREFALANNLLDMYNDRTPESQSQLQNMFDVQQQKAFPINDGSNRIISSALFSKFEGYGTNFKKLAEGTAEAYGNYSRMMTALSGDFGGVGDVAAIFSFMKSLDPRSVVRDSEFQVAANAGGIWDKMKNLQSQYAEGAILPPPVREQMKKYATEIMQTYAKSYKRYRKDAISNMDMLGYGDEGMVNNFLGKSLEIPEFGSDERQYPRVINDAPPLIRRPTPGLAVPTDVSGGQAGTFDFTQLDDFSLEERIKRLEANQ